MALEFAKTSDASVRSANDLTKFEDSLRELLTVSSRHMSPPRHRRSLTDVEAQVLALLASGRSSVEVASRMHLGEAAVGALTARILQKLGVVAEAEAGAVETVEDTHS